MGRSSFPAGPPRRGREKSKYCYSNTLFLYLFSSQEREASFVYLVSLWFGLFYSADRNETPNVSYSVMHAQVPPVRVCFGVVPCEEGGRRKEEEGSVKRLNGKESKRLTE